MSTHHRRRAAAYRDFVTSHGHHPRLVTDSAAEASLARWLVRLEASGEVPAVAEAVRGLVVAAQAQARTEQSVTVDVVKFGYEHLRVPSHHLGQAQDVVDGRQQRDLSGWTDPRGRPRPWTHRSGP